MTVVQNVERGPSNQALKGVKVLVRVGGVGAATSDQTASVIGTSTFTTSTNGQWSFDLIPNSQLTPKGTWYIVERVYPSSMGAAKNVTYIFVPVSTVPVLFEEVVVSEPEAARLTDSELTDHLAHINPHNQYLLQTEAANLYQPKGSGSGSSGPITHTSVTDWDVALAAKKLNSFAAPDGDLALGTNKATGVKAGTADNDAVNVKQLTDATNGLIKVVSLTTAGPPTTGTYSRGQFAIDVNERLFKCTTAGTPGTWKPAQANITIGAVKPTNPYSGDVHITPVN